MSSLSGSRSTPSRRAVARVRLPLPAEAVWQLVTDVRNHERWVPLTRVEAGPRLGVGDTFTAVTGPGARRGWPGLPDRMVVEHLAAPDASSGTPGRATYRKLGPVLLGTAEVHVLPDDDASVLIWTEDVFLRGLSKSATAWLLRPIFSAMLGAVVRPLVAELQHRSP